MGLDMFLYGIEYHSEYDEEDEAFGKKSYYTLTEVIYWRKANQIHNWFVNNVQNGIDNCAMYYVSEIDLIELKEICEKVLEDKSLASLLLPTQSGFFFGSTDYDEFYFEDLKYTVEAIDRILNEKRYDWYKYMSSW